MITGIHKDYDITSQLPEVSVPTLFTCGRFDETRPEEAAWLAPPHRFRSVGSAAVSTQLRCSASTKLPAA